MKIRSLLILLFSILPALLLCAQQKPQSLADAELPSLLAIYKDFHTHPELSGHEERSSAIVAKELKAAGCDVTERVGKYDKTGLTCFGVVGVMKNGAGPTVLVRSDLDALPVHEETGLPYASTVTTKNDGGKEVPVMHACGHDIHMSTGRHGARACEAEGQMARHDHFYRATSRGNGRWRAGDVEGWPLHALAEAELCARLAR